MTLTEVKLHLIISRVFLQLSHVDCVGRVTLLSAADFSLVTSKAIYQCCGFLSLSA